MNSILMCLKKQPAKRLLSFLLLSLFIGNSAFAQVTTSNSSNAIYYLLFIGLCLLCAAVYVIRKASLVLDELGQSIFDFDTSFFKNLAENSKDVTIFIAVIVLIGIYLVLSYGS